MATADDLASTFFTTIGEELTPALAERILATKPSEKLIARIHVLAEKANAGTLTDQERAEYKHFIEIDDAIGILKLKARSLLEDSSP